MKSKKNFIAKDLFTKKYKPRTVKPKKGKGSFKRKKKTFESNYLGCKNLVDFFQDKKIKSFIQIGSCTEYGSKRSPQKEENIIKADKIKTTYGKSKLLSTNYLLKKYKSNKFPCTIFAESGFFELICAASSSASCLEEL